MEKFNFDLQLFAAEGAGTTHEDSGNAGDAAAESGVEKVALDDKGNVRVFYDNQEEILDEDDSDKDEEEGAGKADPGAGGQRPPAGEQAKYTPEEARATDFEKLDPNRLPPEMLPWYKSMQAGFTRKTQELAEAARAMREVAEQVKQPPAEPPAKIDPQQFYAHKHSFIRGNVAKLFGLEESTLPANKSEWPDELQLAYQDIDNDLRGQAKQQLEASQRAAATKTEIGRVSDELRAADQEAYDDLYGRLQGKELPARDHEKLLAAIMSADTKTVRAYFDDYRTKYHAAKNGIRTGEQTGARKPAPKVEATGTGGRSEGKGLPDFAELGKIKSFDQKLAWMRRHGITP